MFVNGDGALTLNAAMAGRIVQITQNDDRTWSQETPEWTKAVEKPSSVLDFTVPAQPGAPVWTLRYGSEEENYRPKISRIENGATEDIALKDLEERFFIQRIGATQDGLLILQGYESGLRVFDPKTGKEVNSFDEYDGYFLLQGNVLTACSTSEKRVMQYDLQKDELIWEAEDAPLTEWDFAATDGEAVYIANAGGVYRIAAGGSLWEKMVDGELTSLRVPSMSVQALSLLNGDPVVLLFSSEGASKLMRYVYDETVPTLPANELRVYTLHENRLLTQAAAAYQTAHPDYLVRVTQLIEEDAAATEADVIRALNTELLAGKGPDVLLLDGMPVASYVEKGVLADLSSALNPMIESGELLPELMNAMRNAGGGLFAAPTGFAVPVLLGQPGDISAVRTLEELVAFVQKGGVPALGKRTLSGYFDMLLPASFPAWFDEDGALKEDVFAGYLESISQIHSAIGVEKDPMEEEIVNWGVFNTGRFTSDGMSLMGGRSYEVKGLKDGAYSLYPLMLDGFNADMVDLTVMGEIDGAVDFLPGQAVNVFEPNGLIGVNAQSAQLDAALAYVKTMLSPEVQDVETFAGFPVSAVSFEKLVEKENSNVSVSLSTTDEETGVSEELSGEWPLRAVREAVYEMAMRAKTPCTTDTELLSMMKTELAPFFAGETDAADAARAVSAKLRAYLAE